MRIVTLEEHLSFPSITGRIPEAAIRERGIMNPGGKASPSDVINKKLEEIGDERIRSMDEAGISTQVLSVAGAGADLLDGEEGIELAASYNNEIAEQMKPWPGRFAAFAHLPLRSPEAAASELERTVSTHNFCGALINGLTEDRFLDDPKFEPILAKAEALQVPVYLHPGIPPKKVREAYYEGLKPQLSTMLGMAGIGWHIETAVHILRLILSGTLDKYPRLQLIIGHMGETLPVLMARCDNIFKQEITGNQRTISETLRQQVYITTSGIFTMPPLQAAIDTFGINRMLFSVDYPFSENKQGRDYLDKLPLGADDLEKIAHKNADRILRLNQDFL